MKIRLVGYKYIHESETCFNKKTGTPLKQYNSYDDAENSASRITDIQLYPYKCERCSFYHLAPLESKINVSKNGCSCKDRNNKQKYLYLTEEDAEKQRLKSQIENHVLLKVYKCKEGKGFHLTHID